MKINQSIKNRKEFELGELGEISAGGTPSRSKLDYWNGSIPWLKISNLKKFYVENYDETITEEGLRNSSAKIFKKGTILISIFASLGDVAILNIDATTNQAIAGIYNLRENISREYLARYLKSLKKHWEKIGRGVAQNNINLGILKSTRILIPALEDGAPDLEKQKQIVAILEKAEGLRDKRKRLDELFDEYLKSVFYEMFLGKDFKVKELRGVCDIIMGQSPRGDSYNETGEGIPFFQGKAEFGEKYTTNKKYTTKPTKFARKNNILMSVRAPVGSVNFANCDCCIGRGLCSFEPHAELLNDYLYYYFKLNEDKIAGMGTGSTFKAITGKQIHSLSIHLPPISLQEKFVSIVEQVEKIKDKLKDEKKGANELFNTLIQKAFSGELI